MPKRPSRRNVYLRAALTELADESGRYRSQVLLLGVGGLRWGEAAALQVSDIEFLRRRIGLHRNAVTVGRHTYLGTLKSGKNRTVVLPQFVIDALAQTAEGKGRDELLWPSATGGYLAPPSFSDSWLSGAVTRCQNADPTFPRVTAHALRHTAASLAISAGANPKVVQRMLGHASAAMTLDVYADLFYSDLTSVADSVGKMWARSAESHRRPTQKEPLPSANTVESQWSPMSGLKALPIPSPWLKARIEVPVVVFARLDDAIAEPSDYRGAARMFANEDAVEEVPGGHFMHREHPETFAERLLAHL